MCGIAGFIYDARGTAPIDWDGLRAALERLGQSSVEGPAAFSPLLAAIEALTPALREYNAFEEIYASESLHTLMAEGAALLTEWEAKTQAVALAPGASTGILEQWNALWVRARDLAWLMERDVLGAQKRVRALLPAGSLETRKARFEAWKLAAILENIGRMEVRGRDSLGLSILVSFGAEGFQQWLSEGGPAVDARRALPDFTSGAILVDEPHRCVVFTFKVAQEVGALGDNVAKLVEQINNDAIFWRALCDPPAATNMFSHTRWASNGIISEPNCHPVTSETVGGARRNGAPHGAACTLAALNGDVDNYQELCASLQSETGQMISPRITTDSKIIPVMIAHHLSRGAADVRDAFCKAVSQFEGSVAIIMHTTADPHRTYLALRGSGQSLYVGIGPHGYVVASELYGVVEHTARFVRMDGTVERIPGKPETAGQVFVLDAQRIDGINGIEAWSFDGERIALDESHVKTAEITTRDINRGEHQHFLLKEISESPISVQKTLQGKFELATEPQRSVHMNLGEDALPGAIVERLKSGQIRRVLLIGQGTAAIAGAAVASMMERTLSASALSISAVKASELSGYRMHESLDDALIIAISQSGTTTDTNRTVDMARQRGAAAIAIVNRRNSDLVYKADGVLYTSDGRDIEMSVASTKAFYSQVVAGYLIALHMALILEVQSQEQVCQELEELSRLPDKMRKVLADSAPVKRFAESFATTKRDWAVVGSGSTRAAAEEIRIKLSELCYKSIATDFIEDKKHIDLSSEPLTLVCAAGLPLMALRDAVKEVAIFKSHKSLPIVICSEGFDAFEPYAAGIIYVPRASENASVLLNTLVGHLWGYYCARAIDRGAAVLRPARALAVQQLSEGGEFTSSAYQQVKTVGSRFQSELSGGLYNSSLSVDAGVQLSSLFLYFTGGRSLGQFSADFHAEGTPANVVERLVVALSRAIHELTRPIDAIKHQAKTITVGISRLEEALEGAIFSALREAGVSHEGLAYRDFAALRAITPATRQVLGVTVYEVRGLGTLGEPQAGSTVRAVRKTGMSAQMHSRADDGHALFGTKESVVRHRSCYVGLGRRDHKPLAIVPILPSGQVEGLVLLHLEFDETLTADKKAAVLRDMQRYDDVRSQVTETDRDWDDRLLDAVPVRDLVTLPVDKLAEQILAAPAAVPT
ncbi:MAG: SIS domain-containing protein [Armatimonadetes bacterium]|nr:SIS domain-containing protein [Armatimonadota bacterium]